MLCLTKDLALQGGKSFRQRPNLTSVTVVSSARPLQCPLRSSIAQLLLPDLDDHLRNALSTEGLTAHELILPQCRDCIAGRRYKEKYSRRDQTGWANDQTKPLNQAHNTINGGAHNRGGEFADEVVEFAAGRAYAEEEGYFDEEDYEGACSRCIFVSLLSFA